jgi:hypothetical protein
MARKRFLNTLLCGLFGRSPYRADQPPAHHPDTSVSNTVSEPIPADDPVRLHDYLTSQRNCQADIRKLNSILAMQHIILEIGCGSCEIARQIAGRNPGWGVIATDLYDSDEPGNATGSRYQRVAGSWKTRGLASQQLPYGNLVVLRAQIEILGLLPYGCVDSVLVVNAEPKVGKSIVGKLYENCLYRRIKPDDKQIVILPHCREIGIYACGGYEFDHSEDWSLGLGYLMDSAFQFKKADPVQWGVDLYRSSPYSGNSTQKNVYIHGVA